MRFLLAVASCFLCACSSIPAVRTIDVRHWGTLQAVHREGDVGPKVALADVVPGPRCYAVGALDGMRGEITIVDDQVWISKPIENGGDRRVTTTCTSSSAESAAVLVAASVKRWKTIGVPEDVPPDRLDAWIGEVAAREGIDVSKPFPFLVDGPLERLDFHVVDGTRLAPTGSPPEFHAYSGVRDRRASVSGRLIGFYAANEQGVIVHHDSRTHVHVTLESPGITGHVDSVAIGKGAVLSLPFDGT